MIHQFSAVKWGTHEQFRDEMNLQEMLIARLVQFYVDHTKLSAEAVRELLRHDSWFSAEQCLEKGIVDELLAQDAGEG